MKMSYSRTAEQLKANFLLHKIRIYTTDLFHVGNIGAKMIKE